MSKNHPHFKDRHSPYCFEPVALEPDVLAGPLEAARWSPSPFNKQPWRFHVIGRENAAFCQVLKELAPRNAMWSQHASFLIVICAEKLKREGRFAKSTSSYQQYDQHTDFSLGICLGLFLAELTKTELQAHPMAGFNAQGVTKKLDLAERLHPLIVLAVGKEIPFDESIHGAFDTELRNRMRVIRLRKPLDQIVTWH